MFGFILLHGLHPFLTICSMPCLRCSNLLHKEAYKHHKRKKMTLFIDFEIVFNLLYVDLPYLCGSDGLVVVVRFKNLELVQVFLDLLVGSALSVRAEDLSHTLVCDNHIVIPVVTIVQHMYYWQDFFIHFQTTTLSFHRSKDQIIWQIIDLLIKGYSFLCIYTSTVH